MAVASHRTRNTSNDAPNARRGAGFGLLCGLALLCGCSRPVDTSVVTPAAAATPPSGPTEAPPPPPARSPAEGDGEIDALLHDLRVQQERVDRELARKEQLALAQAEEAERGPEPDAAPAPAPKTTARAPSKKATSQGAPGTPPPPAPRDDADREPRTDWVGSPCDTACRALASMERSAERICSLTGEGEARCESARAMVKASRERVQASGCWCRSFGPR